MNVTLQPGFAKAVAIAQHLTDAKAMPILTHLLLEAADQHVRLTATDLSASIRLTVPADVGAPGAVALPAQKLAEITRALPSTATLSLAQTEETTVELVCARSTYRLKGLAPADFPEFPAAPAADWLTLPAAVFADLVRKTEFAVRHTADRLHLCGIALATTHDGLRASATNGHRLATLTLAQANGHEAVDAIIPPKGLILAARLATDRGGDVRLAFTPDHGHFVVEQDGCTIATRLIDGTFPDITPVIPRERDHGFEVSRNSLRDALRRLTPILSDSHSVTFTPTETTLVLSGHDLNLGEGREELDCTAFGTPAVFSIQATYLLDYLDRLSADRLRLYITGPLDPLLILPASDETYAYIVMPLRGD
jgi:DNA polymerase-3 subunit beta